MISKMTVEEEYFIQGSEGVPTHAAVGRPALGSVAAGAKLPSCFFYMSSFQHAPLRNIQLGNIYISWIPYSQ